MEFKPKGAFFNLVKISCNDVNDPAVMAIQMVRRILIVIIHPLLVILVSKIIGGITNLPGK